MVGIPMVFVLISTFEIARGMWIYHTLVYSIKAGARYSAVHGENCAITPNACTVAISDIATRIQSNCAGLDPTQFSVTFTPQVGASTTCTLDSCLTNTTMWPPSTSRAVGMTVTVSGIYPFRSIISMFWPGAGNVFRPYSAVNFPAASTERVQY